MKPIINLSTALPVCIPATNELLAARATLDLRLEEIKRAQKACEEASALVNFLAIKALKESSLKAMKGDVIHFVECNRLFWYHNDEYEPLPIALDNYVSTKERGTHV